MFMDRADAGRQLAQALMPLGLQDPVVLALPRGGVPVAAEVARRLRAPMDLLLVRKIGATMQPELAVGAVADADEPVIEIDDETMGATGDTPERIRREAAAQLVEIQRRRALYLQGRALLDVQRRPVVLVDDGIATGTTVRAAIRALRRRGPARVVLAVPVAPASEVERLRAEVDDLVCLQSPSRFGAVGQYYADFSQTTDDEVRALMAAQSVRG
jgi:putative phosphoribosyl transferase